jgi:DNA-binding response OmpR family regulator
LAHVPIVAISVEIEPDDRYLAFQAGCDAYFAKPFNIQELKTYLSQRLG